VLGELAGEDDADLGLDLAGGSRGEVSQLAPKGGLAWGISSKFR
jgi:hypothetical protein